MTIPRQIHFGEEGLEVSTRLVIPQTHEMLSCQNRASGIHMVSIGKEMLIRQIDSPESR